MYAGGVKMGACYSVNLKLGFEREEKQNDAAEAMRKYMKPQP